MRKLFTILMLVCTILSFGQKQKMDSLWAIHNMEQTTSQAGIAVLPVYDIFNVLPKNKISGFAISGNFGYLTVKNISVGINPYYSQPTNSYNNTPTISSNEQTQNIKLYGLNTYLRFYFIKKNKFLAYTSVSVVFGNSEQ